MADDHKTGTDPNANRVLEWLLKHRTEFEANGVDEQSLQGAVGLSEDQLREAVDLLEEHEDVARVPEAVTIPPRFMLKPARGWQEIVEKHAANRPTS